MNEPRPFWRRRWVRRSAVAVLALCLAGVCLHFWQRKLVDWQLDAIRAAGEPVTRADLEWFYPAPPPEKDATRLWLDAFALLEAARESDSEADRQLPWVGDGYEDDPPLPGTPFPHLEVAEKYLARRAEALKLIYQATALGGAARYPMNLSPGEPLFPDLMRRFPMASRTLFLQAIVSAHRGDATDTVAALCAILAMARSLDGAPDVDVGIFKAFASAGAIRRMEKLMPDLPMNEQDLQNFQRMVRDPALARTLWIERCAHRVSTIEMLRDREVVIPSAERFRFRFLWWGNLAAYFEFTARFVAATKAPAPKAMQQTQMIMDEVTQLDDLLYGMAKELIGGDVLHIENAIWSDVLVRGIDAAIGVELFRRLYGRLPGRLDELVPAFLPAVPIDPYSNEPLRYRIGDGRYIIYSVGPDLHDDGGYVTINGSRHLNGYAVEIRLPESGR